MEIRNCFKLSIMVVFLLTAAACSRQELIPERLESQVNRDLRFAEVKESPDLYRGKLILVGGKVLSATRLKEGTRIEVLQRPLSTDLVPEEAEESHGRFVAMDVDNNVIDPAELEDSKLITMVGEVVGMDTVKIDQVTQGVPKLRIKHVTVWDRDRLRPYYGYRSPYAWGYGGYYGYPYYW